MPRSVACSKSVACHSRGSSSWRKSSDIVCPSGRIPSRYFARVGVSATIASERNVWNLTASAPALAATSISRSAWSRSRSWFEPASAMM